MRVASFQIGTSGELGCFAVGAFRPQFPDRFDLLLMQVAANQVAIALQQTDLLMRHEETERLASTRAARQAIVASIGLRALHGRSLDETCAEAVVALREALQVDCCEVLELAPDGESLLLRCGSGWPSSLVGSERVSAAFDVEAGFAIRSAEPVVVRDLAVETRFAATPHQRAHGIVSSISVLIQVKTVPFGVLGAHSRDLREFTEEEVDFQQSLANLLSAAVERHLAEAEREALLARTEAAQEEAERASRAKSEFLGMMSHELRTPLNAIAGYTQLIDEGIRGPVTDAQRADLARIRRSQEYLVGLINNVLSFLKLGSGKVEYDIAVVGIERLFAEIEDLIRPLMQSKRLIYEQCAPPEGASVRADAEKVQQIVLNLLSNAVKFSEPGSSVRLDCIVDGSMVSTRVRDSGHGIPADKLQRVFEPFVRLQAGASHRVEGTGLGLAISRDFALGMAGQLSVQSELGKGSTFTLTLPRGPHVQRG